MVFESPQIRLISSKTWRKSSSDKFPVILILHFFTVFIFFNFSSNSTKNVNKYLDVFTCFCCTTLKVYQQVKLNSRKQERRIFRFTQVRHNWMDFKLERHTNEALMMKAVFFSTSLLCWNGNKKKAGHKAERCSRFNPLYSAWQTRI